MIEIHNKSTYQRIYSNFSAEFIDAYCAFRYNGLNSEMALEGARNKILKQLEKEIYRKNSNIKILMKAYKNVRNDSELIKRAIHYYQNMSSMK